MRLFWSSSVGKNPSRRVGISHNEVHMQPSVDPRASSRVIVISIVSFTKPRKRIRGELIAMLRVVGEVTLARTSDFLL